MSDASLIALHSACLSLLALLAAPSKGGGGEPIRPAPAPPAFHDCNGNGVEDRVDIALGTSSDADLDGVPDECQVRRPGPRRDT